jgi:hypothetical protein
MRGHVDIPRLSEDDEGCLRDQDAVIWYWTGGRFYENSCGMLLGQVEAFVRAIRD